MKKLGSLLLLLFLLLPLAVACNTNTSTPSSDANSSLANSIGSSLASSMADQSTSHIQTGTTTTNPVPKPEPEPDASPVFHLRYAQAGGGYKVVGYEMISDRDSNRLGDLLDEVVIPATYNGAPVHTIAEGAFDEIFLHINSITIPDSILAIEKGAFGSGYGGNVSVDEMHISSLDAWCAIFFGGETPLSCGADLYLNDTRITELVIPSSVTSIGKFAFWGCTSLTSVTIPNSVTSIGNCAFAKCTSLTSVTIGGSVTSIGAEAFLGCTSLTSITLPSSVTSLGSQAFSLCDKLVEVCNHSPFVFNNEHYGSEREAYGLNNSIAEVHNGTSKIVNQNGYLFYPLGDGNYLLGYVGADTDLTLPASYNGENYKIYRYAFRDCTGLTSVTIPSSVTSIGSSAFEGCTGLTGVYITDLAAWCKISFPDYTANPLYYAGKLYLNNILVTNLTLPSSVTTININAFRGCTSLTSVTIPSSVTFIGYHAFKGCTALASVTFESTTGWYYTTDSSATSGTALNVTAPATNATLLTGVRVDYFWKQAIA